ADIERTSGPEALARLPEALDPEMALGAVRLPEQEALLPHLEALVAVVIGYVDHVMDDIGGTLIGSYRQVTEAVRRRRVGTGDADRFVERILGLNLTLEQGDRRSAFVAGVGERSGTDGLGRLWTCAPNLPTPSEEDAPGLGPARIYPPDPSAPEAPRAVPWLARIDPTGWPATTGTCHDCGSRDAVRAPVTDRRICERMGGR
nr:zinc-dependent metalloprotease [Actinomycetota bacterium]